MITRSSQQLKSRFDKQVQKGFCQVDRAARNVNEAPNKSLFSISRAEQLAMPSHLTCVVKSWEGEFDSMALC